jgi:threonine aldolase
LDIDRVQFLEKPVASIQLFLHNEFVRLVRDYVESNMVILDVSKTGLAPGHLHQRLAERGIRVGVFGPTLIWAVTYMNVTRRQLERIAAEFGSIRADPKIEI